MQSTFLDIRVLSPISVTFILFVCSVSGHTCHHPWICHYVVHNTISTRLLHPIPLLSLYRLIEGGQVLIFLPFFLHPLKCWLWNALNTQHTCHQ
jgi:hypothetical protein